MGWTEAEIADLCTCQDVTGLRCLVHVLDPTGATRKPDHAPHEPAPTPRGPELSPIPLRAFRPTRMADTVITAEEST